MDKTQRNRLTILEVLKGGGGILSSPEIAELLAKSGNPIAERTVRLYLNELDKSGLTENHGRRGRSITDKGVEELRAANTLRRVGYLSSKIDRMTYQMGFDLSTRSGQVVVNTSVIEPGLLFEHVEKICEVFAQGYAMGNRLYLAGPGEQIGEFLIPNGMVGFCTVCSITINGVLLKHGIPTTSRFGGLLELQGRKATRFVEMIHYDGTSIDPLVVFIRGGMTDYHGAIRDGNGRIGASFREHPADARELLVALSDQLARIGLGAFMEIGLPSQDVFGVPVSPEQIGAVVIGGLNPVAILEESNHRIKSQALSGLLEYNLMYPFDELPTRLNEFL